MAQHAQQARSKGRKAAAWLGFGATAASAIALLTWRLGGMPGTLPSTTPLATSATAAPSPTAISSLAAAALDVRARILEIIEARPVTSASQLERYLAQLEVQARVQGVVTALEVEPGMAMAQEFAGQQRAMAFAERMAQLRQELSDEGPETPVVLAGVQADLQATLAEIKATSGEEKQLLIAEYLERVADLPPDEAGSAYAQINAVAGQASAPGDVDTVEALWNGIENAKDDDERQALIREYLEVVHDLPEAEAARRLETLNRRFGAAER